VVAPGAATAVSLQPEATTLDADMSDARLVFIYILDANGTVVPSASTQVNLSVTGAGTLVGPATVTTKGGELATWVRAQRTAGTITLTASATGLTSATVTLTSQAVANLPPAPANRP
jgi:beta-galactosidase